MAEGKACLTELCELQVCVITVLERTVAGSKLPADKHFSEGLSYSTALGAMDVESTVGLLLFPLP